MIRLFGGYEPYKNAPAHVVEEQIIVWMAEKMAEIEKAREDARH